MLSSAGVADGCQAGLAGSEAWPCMQEIKLLLLKGRKRSVTALGRAAVGVEVLRELVRPGNLL